MGWLNFSEGEWIAIQELLYDNKPRNRKEWVEAVSVGRSIGQGVERGVRVGELLRQERFKEVLLRPLRGDQ